MWVAAAITPLAMTSDGSLWFVLPAAILTVAYVVGLLGDYEGGH